MAADTAGFLKKRLGGLLSVGIGALRLELERTTFELGDAIIGRVELRLDQDVEGRKLVAGLRCDQRRTLYQQEDVLDGARTYRSRGYDLRLRLPTTLRVPHAPRWIVYACLFRDHGPNLREHLEIDVQ